MKCLYIYQNYRKSYSGLGKTLLSYFKQETRVEVIEFQFKPFSYHFTVSRIINRLPLINKMHFELENKRLIREVNKLKPDCIFVMKGTDLYPETLKYIRAEHPKIKLACFNPDDPFNLNNASSKTSILACMDYYDHYFIWSKALKSKIEERGIKAHYLPFATDKELIYPVEPTGTSYDLAFIGNGDKERNEWIAAIAKEMKSREVAFGFHVFGANIQPVDGITVEGQRNGRAYLEAMVSSKVNINILRLQNKNATNMRTFEIPASGAFMMHESSDEAKAIFIEDQEAVYFSSIEELIEKTTYYLEHEEERLAIARKGYLKAISYEQSYNQRILNIINTLCR